MSSSDRAAAPSGAHGLLRGSRARSYGSLVSSPVSPARQKRIEHQIEAGDTLQGLSLKYGVSMEQIKRANRLYTNDSIFLKKSLSIPVLSEYDLLGNGEAVPHDRREGSKESNADLSQSSRGRVPENDQVAEDLSPLDYLKRMDGLISQSKQAAAVRCQDLNVFPDQETDCSSRPLNGHLSSRGRQPKAVVGTVPLTVTKRIKKLRETEEEIFQL
ncbi:lysM and putative peptidoglycan-binding domain-containing protein 1 [Denticeps clupeoides]|uniref:LysM and putative peptidoglycan-binding domain-containing protein 1 n=1 Tax=Denticeps clupeoides TaxID=299321 RepID=A0AAY4B7A6_9TELE|nr:lysM and putative peptidoglycan-binding domain-containing protein 1 [Denticeps clupeoides]